MAKLGGIDWLNKQVLCGTYTATAGDASADKSVINTGQSAAIGFVVQIIRSGVVSGGDEKVSLAAGVLTVEDGESYKVTAGDVINWMVF